MEIENLYPFFDKKNLLSLQPSGGFFHIIDEESNKKDKVYELNKSAIEIIERCNGSKRLKEIICEFEDKKESHEIIITFIIELARERILKFSDIPKKSSTTFSGNTTFFSPIHLSIELTNYCNLYCRHCYRESGPNLSTFLSSEKIIPQLEIFAKNGVRTIELTGGEPLTHPHFIDIFFKATEIFQLVAIVTNGTLINDKTIVSFKKSKSKIFLQLDLDGDTSEIHDFLRGKRGSFSKVCHAAKKLKIHNIPFRIAMNVHSENLSHIRQTAKLAKELGASTFSFSPILKIGRAKKISVLSVKDYKEFFSIADELESTYPDFVKVKYENSEGFFNSKHNCGAGYRSLVIGPSGNIRPCLMLNEKYGVFGNVFDDEYIKIIRNSPLNFFFNLNSPNEKICKGCKHLIFCMGCFSRPFHVSSKKGNRNQNCQWNTKNKLFELMQQL
jgi:radical SAM protein with 4Fe4S-binding SPASM domain